MKVVIVGGGTAGWMTAAFFRNNLPSFDITVIDKEQGTPIGVGEATLLDFSDFMAGCGFQKHEWIPAVSATFKSGILFPNWGKEGNLFWHPFLTNTQHDAVKLSQFDVWSAYPETNFLDHALPFFKSSQDNLIDPYNLDLYAYHVDCGKLVVYLQSKLEGLVNVIRSEVKEVVRNQHAVEFLSLVNGQQIEADLYIDCTGFSSLLKQQDKVNLEDRLFCNTAAVGQISYENETEEKRPYAICSAVEHGWTWRIPVQHRLGCGLVFNRNITDPETAKDYFYEHLNGRLSKEKIRIIDWTPYYIKNFWETNVVSVGLSGGFVEPLESTGISLIRLGIKKLAEKLRLDFFDQYDIDHYNATMIRHFEDVVDFVNMHYSHSDREGAFWQHVKSVHQKSDIQMYYEDICIDENKMLYELCQPDLKDNRIFGPGSWFAWLIQLGVPLKKDITINPLLVERTMGLFLKSQEIKSTKGISHQDMLDSINSVNTK